MPCACSLKNPLYTAAAVLPLSVGIAVNTATFSLADLLLFRPLDIPGLGNFYAVFGAASGHPMGTGEITPGDFEGFRRESKLTEYLCATDWFCPKAGGAADACHCYFGLLDTRARAMRTDPAIALRQQETMLGAMFWAPRI